MPNAPRDLDLVGCWLPAIEGTALPLPTGDQIDFTKVDAGRPAGMDERSGEVARVVQVLRRLDALAASGPDGPRHVVVLFYLFALLGESARSQLKAGFSPPRDGFGYRIGMLLADEETRAGWFDGLPGDTRARAVAFGMPLVLAADAAYAALPEGSEQADQRRPRISLPALRDTVGKLDASRRQWVKVLTGYRARRLGLASDPDALANGLGHEEPANDNRSVDVSDVFPEAA